MGKKILSLVCALCLVASMFTIGIFAASAEETGETPTETVTPVLNDWSKWEKKSSGSILKTDDISALAVITGNWSNGEFAYKDKVNLGDKWDLTYSIIFEKWLEAKTNFALNIGDLSIQLVKDTNKPNGNLNIVVKKGDAELYKGTDSVNLYVRDENETDAKLDADLIKKVGEAVSAAYKNDRFETLADRLTTISVKFDKGKLEIYDDGELYCEAINVENYDFSAANVSFKLDPQNNYMGVAAYDISANTYTTPGNKEDEREGVILTDWSKWNGTTAAWWTGEKAAWGKTTADKEGYDLFYVKADTADASKLTTFNYGEAVKLGNDFDYSFSMILPTGDNWRYDNTWEYKVTIGSLVLDIKGVGDTNGVFKLNATYKDKTVITGEEALTIEDDANMIKKVQEVTKAAGSHGPDSYCRGPMRIRVSFKDGDLKIYSGDKLYASATLSDYDFSAAKLVFQPIMNADNSHTALYDVVAKTYATPDPGKPDPEKPTEKGVKLEAKTDLVLDTDTFEGNTDDIKEANGKKYFFREDIRTTTINTKTAYDLGTGFEVTAKLAYLNWAKENNIGEHASIFFNEPGKGLELRIYSYCSNKKNGDGSYHNADDCNKNNDGHHVAGMEYKYDIAVCVDGVAVANYTTSSPNGTYTLRYLEGKVSVLFNGAPLKLTLASDKTEAKKVSVDGLDFSNTKIGLLMTGNWCREADSRSWYDISVAPASVEDDKGVKLDSKVQLPFNENTFNGAINGFKEGGYFYSTVNLINVDTITRYDLGTKFALEANLVFANPFPNYYGEHASMYVGTMGEGLELRVYVYCGADHNVDECNKNTDGHHSILKVGTYDVCLYYNGKLIGNCEGDCNEAPNGTYTLKYNEGKVSVDLNGETLNIKTPGGATAKTVDIADADFSNTTVGLAIMGNWHTDPTKRNWNTFSIAPLSGNGSIINNGGISGKTGDTRNIALAIAIMLGSASAAGLILLNKKQLAK